MRTLILTLAFSLVAIGCDSQSDSDSECGTCATDTLCGFAHGMGSYVCGSIFGDCGDVTQAGTCLTPTLVAYCSTSASGNPQLISVDCARNGRGEICVPGETEGGKMHSCVDQSEADGDEWDETDPEPPPADDGGDGDETDPEPPPESVDEPGPEFEWGSGACANEADMITIHQPDQEPMSVALDAGINCHSEPDLSHCTAVEVSEVIGISYDCALCYGEQITCLIENCLSDCVGNPNGDACVACQAVNCWPLFESCSGFPMDG